MSPHRYCREPVPMDVLEGQTLPHPDFYRSFRNPVKRIAGIFSVTKSSTPAASAASDRGKLRDHRQRLTVSTAIAQIGHQTCATSRDWPSGAAGNSRGQGSSARDRGRLAESRSTDDATPPDERQRYLTDPEA